MMCASVVIILVRKTRKVHFSYTMLVGSTWGFCQSVIAASAFNAMEWPRSTKDLILAFGLLPIFLCSAQFSIIMALKFDGAGPVSLVRALEVIFAFSLQIIFLGVMPDLFSFVGAFVIVCGVAILTLRKWVSTLPEHDSRRKRFILLLK